MPKFKTSVIIALGIFVWFFIGGTATAGAASRVKTVDFLSRTGLKVNAAGPLLVRPDDKRDRVILVNTYTSSISIIDTKTKQVKNIGVKSRVPQYVKEEALCLDYSTGNVYVIGSKSLHMVFPGKGTSVTVDTGKQYEMVAVDEKTGNVFLAGRASKTLAMIKKGASKITHLPWQQTEEKLVNLNQTPPPPIRKVFCDASLRRVIAVDGNTSELALFSADSGKLLKKRKLGTSKGSRWHTAGYNTKTHHLYLVVETAKREVIEAIKVDIRIGKGKKGKKDTIIKLPGLHEGVGISYNAARDEVYVPYDNEPTVHAVSFPTGKVTEIKIPAYGNDASAIDEANDRLYVTSWAYGEIDVVDLKTKRFMKRIKDVGILPHMFNMAFSGKTGELYIPLGATAVNGSFGAGIKTLNPETGKSGYIYTGWAPVALVEMNGKDSGFMVFNSEDEAAVVQPDGTASFHKLPCRWVNNAVSSPWGTIYTSYGPHQSYWPTVYIWAAKNGILGIEPSGQPGEALSFFDRRIPRMAHKMVLDKNGILYALQNNWGGELQFLSMMPDAVRFPNLGNQRLEINERVERETTQRILKYDQNKHWLYVVRTGETDDNPGILQIFNPGVFSKKQKNPFKPLLSFPSGRTPTDLVFNDTTVYIANFDDNTITALTKNTLEIKKIKTGDKPFKLAILKKKLYWINHNGNTLQHIDENGKTGKTTTHALPYPGKPSNLFSTGKDLIITIHSKETLYIVSFNPASHEKKFELLHQHKYPFGETTVDTDNSAFYMRGQFGDGIFELNQIKQDKKGRLWVTDYLSGKLFIIEKK